MMFEWTRLASSGSISTLSPADSTPRPEHAGSATLSVPAFSSFGDRSVNRPVDLTVTSPCSPLACSFRGHAGYTLPE